MCFAARVICVFSGAQSDSELPSGSIMTDGCSDRGYTSDSELETRSQSHLHRGPSGEFEVQPVPENGSWMLVSSLYRKTNMSQHTKKYNKTCVTSKDSDQPLHLPSIARVLIYPLLDSLDVVEGTCDQRRL